MMQNSRRRSSIHQQQQQQQQPVTVNTSALREADLAIKAEVDYKLQNKSFTDVTFIVGPPQHSKKYVGHRVLLAMTSPVFETMFYGDMADKNKYIRIVDVAPIGFENLLRFAYTDSLNLNSVDDAMLTAYAAKKYLLPQLLLQCLSYIERNVCASSACHVFEFARVLNSHALALQATQLIDTQTTRVLSSKSFLQIQHSTLEFISKRKYLTLESEAVLASAVIRWLKAELKRRKLITSTSNSNDEIDWLSARALLNNATREYQAPVIRSLRFLSMTSAEFANFCALSSATTQQVNKQFEHRSSNVASPSSTSSTQQQQQQQLLQQTNTVDVNSDNSLLTASEQRAVFLNLAQRHLATLPGTLNASYNSRKPPPPFFSVSRYHQSANNDAMHHIVGTPTVLRALRIVASKFQSLSRDVYLVGLTLPIRSDSVRSAKLECHLKFTTRATPTSVADLNNNCNTANNINDNNDDNDHLEDNHQFSINKQRALDTELDSDTNIELSTPQTKERRLPANLASVSKRQLMDSVDEALTASIARDKDCYVQLARPIYIHANNVNELTVTFHSFVSRFKSTRDDHSDNNNNNADNNNINESNNNNNIENSDDDYFDDTELIIIRTPAIIAANNGRAIEELSATHDSERNEWLFYRSGSVELAQLHYYY